MRPYLISDRDPRNPPPGLRTPQTGQVALFETQVRERRECGPSWNGPDRSVGVDDVRGDAVGVVGRGLGWVVPRRRGWGVDVMARGGVLLEGGGLKGLWDLHGWV